MLAVGPPDDLGRDDLGLLPAPVGLVRAGAPVAVRRLLVDAAVSMMISERDGRLSLTIGDDGVGGADPDGPGLSGLRKRVEALEGSLAVESPPGGPTIVHAEIPCGS